MRIIGFCLLLGGLLWQVWAGVMPGLTAYAWVIRSHGADVLESLEIAPQVTTFTRKEVEQIAVKVAERIHYSGGPIGPPLLTTLAGGLILAYAKRRRKPVAPENREAGGMARGPKTLTHFLGFRRKVPTPNPALQRTATGVGASSEIHACPRQ